MANKLSRHEKQRLSLIAAFSFLLLIAYVVFSPYGLLKHFRLQNEIKTVKKENTLLEQKNKELAAEIERLKNDPDYVEKVAREQYGMIKKNEILFEFKNKK